MKEYHLEKEAGFKCDTWPAKNVPNIRPFPEEMWEILRTLDVKPLTGMYQGFNMDPLLENLDSPMAKGAVRVFQSEKIEKICIWWQVLSGRSISGAVIGFPRDDYDFPVMLIDWDEGRGPGHGMVDHMPLCDIVLNEEYRVKYLDKLDNIFREYYDIVGPPSLHVWFRTLTGPYYSFFRTQAGGTPEYRQRIFDLPIRYLQQWAETVKEAKPITDPAHREYCIKRKRILQEWLYVRDPVASVMLRCYGREIGSLVMKGLS